MQAKPHAAAQTVLTRLFWLVPLAFYGATVSRTPGWVDAPLLAKVVHRVELSTWVNNHNLFTLVGSAWLRLMPGSLDPHYALNLLCALLGALTVYVVFLIGLRLTSNAYASIVGAIVLMVSHSLWWHSTMLEVYTLSTLLLVTLLLLVLRYEERGRLVDLGAGAFVFGLACSNHPQMGLLSLGFVGLMLWPESRAQLLRPRSVLILTLCFLMGFQVYLWIFGFELVGYLRSTAEAEPLVVLRVMLDRASGGDFRQYMFPSGLSMRERLFWWVFYLGFFVYNFPLPWILLAPVGALAWVRKKSHRISLAFFGFALLAQVIWSANYFVWDMYAFSLPAYVMTGILVVLGVDWLCRRSKSHRVLVYALTCTVMLIPLCYAKAPSWIGRSEQAQGVLSRIPQYAQAAAFWDPLDYFFNPNKRSYDRVQRYSKVVLSELEPAACYWGNEATLFYPLKYYYQDVLGEREDVSYHLVFGIVELEEQLDYHVAAMLKQLEGGRPVYISSLGYPERNVLVRVYDELDPHRETLEISRLSDEKLRQTFPRYRFEPLVLDAAEGVRIYRLRER